MKTNNYPKIILLWLCNSEKYIYIITNVIYTFLAYNNWFVHSTDNFYVPGNMLNAKDIEQTWSLPFYSLIGDKYLKSNRKDKYIKTSKNKLHDENTKGIYKWNWVTQFRLRNQ